MLYAAYRSAQKGGQHEKENNCIGFWRWGNDEVPA